MALSFIKRVFSFGKDDQSKPPAETPVETPVLEPAITPPAESPVIDPVTAEHLGDRMIVPDSINPQDFEDPREEDVAAELREQAESVAEFSETVEEEPVPEVIPPDEPGIEVAEPVADTALAIAAEPPVDATLAAEIQPQTYPVVPEAETLVAKDIVPEASPAAEPVVDSNEADEPQVAGQQAEPEVLPEPEPEVLPEPEAKAETPAAEAPVASTIEPPATIETPVADPAPEAPRTPAILPAGFSSTADRVTPEAVTAERKLSWIERLRQGLSRTSAQLTSQITSLFTKRKLDDETLQDLEDLLIQADLGVETALRITDTLAADRYGKDVSGEDVSKIMASEITKVLGPVAKPLELDLNHKPHVILVVGVNGTGKTTTIGKLAAKLTRGGLKVMLAAGDTFRAAAIEQLHIWADRTGADIVSSRLGADAAGLAYEAYEKAKQSGHDVLIIDTAGRLQNKTELMAELEKIVRVLGRLDPDAPHTVLQTLDATTGQNALNQVEIFRNVAGVSGLIMTKLDGTARGGILVAISAKHKLPVCFIGVGEGIDDLEPFNAKDFAEAIAGIQTK